MVDYREILRLAHENCSQRSIAASIHSSHHTVSEILKAAKEKHIEWPLDENVTNAQLEEILFPNKYYLHCNYLPPDFEHIHKELAKPGVTLTLLWTEYVRSCEACGKRPYMTTQFGDKYREWAKITKATMRISHKPGDAMEVDWAGNTLSFQDSTTGESYPVYLFVAALPCSCFTYAEACTDMKTENWLSCHVHAYEYFGGVTRLLIPDNLKTGVTKNTRYETILNRSYQELAEYYNTAVVPARVEHPKDKSHAEGAVKFASTWIIASLRNERFFCFEDVRSAVAMKLDELNDRPFRSGRVGSRRSAFLNEESAFLKPLPFKPYEIATWLPPVQVGFDYVVPAGENRYSVPFDLIGKKVDVKLTHDTVEVYYHGSRVASHLRRREQLRDPIINPDHMTEEHRKYLNYNADRFTEWGNHAGKHIAVVIRHFLKCGKAPEQGYKFCVSLMKLSEKYGTDRLETACESILRYSSEPTIRIISSALKNGYEDRNTTADSGITDESNSYGITRGEAYFRRDGGKE